MPYKGEKPAKWRSHKKKVPNREQLQPAWRTLHNALGYEVPASIPQGRRYKGCTFGTGEDDDDDLCGNGTSTE